MLDFNKQCFVHAAIEPIKAKVHNKCFYNVEDTVTGYTNVTIFGISCIKNLTPCFEIITDDGCVFSDIPIHMIKHTDESDVFSLSDLCYNNCLSNSFTLCKFDHLSDKIANVYFKEKDIVVSGKYILSIDFYNDNNWFHFIKLNNGYFSFMPSHKIKFDKHELKTITFPKFLKLRKTFSV